MNNATLIGIIFLYSLFCIISVFAWKLALGAGFLGLWLALEEHVLIDHNPVIDC